MATGNQRYHKILAMIYSNGTGYAIVDCNDPENGINFKIVVVTLGQDVTQGKQFEREDVPAVADETYDYILSHNPYRVFQRYSTTAYVNSFDGNNFSSEKILDHDQRVYLFNKDTLIYRSIEDGKLHIKEINGEDINTGLDMSYIDKFVNFKRLK